MENSIILSTPLILFLSIVALLLLVMTRFMSSNKWSILSIVAFLCIVASITYALLLGADIQEVLIYVLLFTFVSMLQFVPSKSAKDEIKQNTDEQKEQSNDVQSNVAENSQENSELLATNTHEGENK